MSANRLRYPVRPAAARRRLLVAAASGIVCAAASFVHAQEPAVRWRNITRERLPKDVAAVALEYSVILVKDGKERPVDPNGYQFDVGDRILVRIQPQDDMYIYVFTEGPQGAKDCLLPTSDEKPAQVKKGKVIELPDDGFFRFSDPPGEEKLIVVATVKPAADLAALSNVVFRKPEDLLTEQEKKEKQNILNRADKRLDSTVKMKANDISRRGILSEKAIDEFNTELKIKKRGTLVEPPHDDLGSTYAVAVADKTMGMPELLMTIPLRSRAGAQ